jgi:GNAT superfamily N-acetyltransferase
MDYALRPARSDERDFAFEVKRQAMGPHIKVKWGWDEGFQREHHAKRWAEKTWYIVLSANEPAGTVSLDWLPTHLRFGEFYLLAQHRGRGLGTRVLRGALSQADSRELETRLEFLKWNPVGRLYLRHGFRVVGESDIHYLAVRLPNAA